MVQLQLWNLKGTHIHFAHGSAGGMEDLASGCDGSGDSTPSASPWSTVWSVFHVYLFWASGWKVSSHLGEALVLAVSEAQKEHLHGTCTFQLAALSHSYLLTNFCLDRWPSPRSKDWKYALPFMRGVWCYMTRYIDTNRDERLVLMVPFTTVVA